MNNSAAKVGEIFREAGTAFNKLSEMTMLLYSINDSNSGEKWTNEDVELLQDCVNRFAVDLNKISHLIKNRTMTPADRQLFDNEANLEIIEPPVILPPAQSPLPPSPPTPSDLVVVDSPTENSFNPENVPQVPPDNIMQSEERPKRRRLTIDIDNLPENRTEDDGRMAFIAHMSNVAPITNMPIVSQMRGVAHMPNIASISNAGNFYNMPPLQPNMQVSPQSNMQVSPRHSMQVGTLAHMQVSPQHSMQVGPQHHMQVSPQPNMQIGRQPHIQVTPRHSMQIGIQPHMQTSPQYSMQVGRQSHMPMSPQDSIHVGSQHYMQMSPQHSMHVGPQHHVQASSQHNIQVGRQSHVQVSPQHSMQVGPQHHMQANPHPNMQVGPQPHMQASSQHGMQVGQQPHLQVSLQPNIQVGRQPHVQLSPQHSMQVGPQHHMQANPHPNMQVGLQPHMQPSPQHSMQVGRQPHMQVSPQHNMQVGPQPHMQASPARQVGCQANNQVGPGLEPPPLSTTTAQPAQQAMQHYDDLKQITTPLLYTGSYHLGLPPISMYSRPILSNSYNIPKPQEESPPPSTLGSNVYNNFNAYNSEPTTRHVSPYPVRATTNYNTSPCCGSYNLMGTRGYTGMGGIDENFNQADNTFGNYNNSMRVTGAPSTVTWDRPDLQREREYYNYTPATNNRANYFRDNTSDMSEPLPMKITTDSIHSRTATVTATVTSTTTEPVTTHIGSHTEEGDEAPIDVENASSNIACPPSSSTSQQSTHSNIALSESNSPFESRRQAPNFYLINIDGSNNNISSRRKGKPRKLVSPEQIIDLTRRDYGQVSGLEETSQKRKHSDVSNEGDASICKLKCCCGCKDQEGKVHSAADIFTTESDDDSSDDNTRPED